MYIDINRYRDIVVVKHTSLYAEVVICDIKYRVYKDGQVYSYFIDRPCSPDEDKDGYYVYRLGNPVKAYKAHLLVLTVFDRPPKNKREQCRHLDGSKDNNTVSNLKWGTGVSNYRDRVRHGTHNSGERHGRAKLTMQQVVAIKRYKTGYGTAVYLARKYNVSPGLICAVRKGRVWQSQ